MQTIEEKKENVSEVLNRIHVLSDEERTFVWTVLRAEFESDSTEYNDDWIPFLATLPWDSEPLVLVYSMERLNEAVQIAPHARFGLSLTKGFRGANIGAFLNSDLRERVVHVEFRRDEDGKLPSEKMLTDVVSSAQLDHLKSIEFLLADYSAKQLKKLGSAFALPVRSVQCGGWNDDRQMKTALSFFDEFNPPELECLNIHSSKMGVKGVKTMANWRCLGGLESLNLEYCRLRDRGVEELSKIRTLERLGGLNLRGNAITDVGLGAFIECENFSELRSLNFGDNRITIRGVEQLASCEKLGALNELDIRVNSIFRSDHIMDARDLLVNSPFLTDCAIKY